MLRRAAKSLASAWLLTLSAVAAAESPTSSEVATTVQDLQRRLAAPVDVAWSGAPLRNSLLARTRLSGIALVIDRRVDPGVSLELTAAGRPLGSLLEQVAAAHHLGVSSLGSVAYLGPSETARDLRTVAELRRLETQELPLDLRTALARKSPLMWPDLAEPRDLLLQLAGAARLTVSDPELLPHDLWPAATLPPLTLVERLTLVTASFGLSFRIDGERRTLTLVPIDAAPRIERVYMPGGEVVKALAAWQRAAPDAVLARHGAGIRVSGRVEDHETLRHGAGPAPSGVANAAASAKSAPALAGERRYTLRLKNKPFAALVALLRDTHKLPIEVDEEAVRTAGISLDTFTNVEVADATLEELLRQAGAPLGLTVRAEAGKLRIVPAAE